MTTFAHTETGQALDPLTCLDIAEYQKWSAMVPDSNAWVIVEVPDGTQHGAKPDNGGNYYNADGSIANADGTLTGPPKPLAPESVPATTKQQFLDQIKVLNALASKLS